MSVLASPATEHLPGRFAPLWRAVAGLIDGATSSEQLRWHRLHLLAVARWRAQGQPIEPTLAEIERLAAARLVSTPFVLEQIRAACEGRIVLMKGYEIALRYDDPITRPFGDIDLLVENAPAAHNALRAAGFVEIGNPDRYLEIHHLRPLSLPDLLLPVELHREPKWPEGLTPPSTPLLLDAAVPSSTGVDGIDTLSPADHALVLAAHSWAHLPLRRIQELVDIALVREEADAEEIEARARACGFDRVWRTTRRSIDSLFYGAPRSSAERIWARHLATARERTVFESHVERWLSPFWALSRRRASSAMAAAVSADLGPAEGEDWSAKLSRAGKALRNASSAKTAHERELGEDAHRRRRQS
jgi:hypothetical protein